jgi:4-nitrophenyl phosphatase
MEPAEKNSCTQLLRHARGFAFDLDGTIWAGPTLLPGAVELVSALREAGVRVVFASNSSRHGSEKLARRLTDMGIDATVGEVLTAFDLVADEIRDQLGPVRVLCLGTRDLECLLESAGHEVVPIETSARPQAVVVGNDPDFDFNRLRVAARAVDAGARLFAVNMDSRFPVGENTFDPGCGALVEAVAVAAGVRPYVIGKPYLPLFARTIERLGCRADQAVMVGDNLPSDIAGGRAAGMITVWLDGRDHPTLPPEVDFRVTGLPELQRLWLEQSRGAVTNSTPVK